MHTESERKIFAFKVNGEEAAIDPMEAWEKIYQVLGGDDLGGLLTRFNSGDPPLRVPAGKELAEIGRAVFGLEPFRRDGTGSTRSEAIDLLFNFWAWEDALRGKPDGSPNSSEPTPESSETSTTELSTASG